MLPMKTILNGLPMYAYWSGRAYVYIGRLEVHACVSMCVYVCGACACVWCVCVVRVCGACVWCVCVALVCGV